VVMLVRNESEVVRMGDRSVGQPDAYRSRRRTRIIPLRCQDADPAGSPMRPTPSSRSAQIDRYGMPQIDWLAACSACMPRQRLVECRRICVYIGDV
jgi:hypothetical protein